jgi:putative tryptophan/tyrosine transport system substrate-binding protein
MRRRAFITLVGTAAFGWPLGTYAQQTAKAYRVSYLALLPGEDAVLVKPFLERLHELGYTEGRNLIFEYRSAEGQQERLHELAGDLVRASPDVLIAGFGTLSAQAARAATTTIPVVFTSVGDPLGAGLVGSLNRPGANVTGLTSQASDIVGKRLQILNDLIPGEHRVAVLFNPDTPFTPLALKELRTAADARRQRLEVFEARSADDVSAGIEAAVKAGATGLITLEDPLLLGLRRQITELASKLQLPGVYGDRSFAEAGGLIAYGVDRRQQNRRAAEYVDRILKGAKPADLPVEQPTRFEFVINLKAAKALGLTIPQSLLATADEVIE